MANMKSLHALEILDSRGRPTLKTTCTLYSGASGSASVPSGRSTGTAEALELRDKDPARYRGMGCKKAVANVNSAINNHFTGRRISTQQELDAQLCELDGTDNKRKLGANAILSVSIAFARAQAQELGIPLYQAFANMIKRQASAFPRLTINLFSGGKHAGKQVAIQDVLVVPSAPASIEESLVLMSDVYHAAADIIHERYGMRLLTADEGGLAPPFEDTEKMLQTAVEAMRSGGYVPGQDVHLALDVAASHFYSNGSYQIDGSHYSSSQMIELFNYWCDTYPIVSIEDGLFEDDWQNWPALQSSLGHRILVLGDDFLCTNPDRIKRAIDQKACNALLLKVNQIGTLSEAAQSYVLAKEAGWLVTISVRSGETEDDWAADLALGWSG
ncbi:MAG: phosphopyruvate hydratase, partial [Desulfobacterales bacterium]|nr:phosphopyruvate hydratase [Desulfobacterales bacterium]